MELIWTSRWSDLGTEWKGYQQLGKVIQQNGVSNKSEWVTTTVIGVSRKSEWGPNKNKDCWAQSCWDANQHVGRGKHSFGCGKFELHWHITCWQTTAQAEGVTIRLGGETVGWGRKG